MNWKKLYNILLPLVATALAGMFGYDKVEEYRASQPAPDVDVSVTFANAPTNDDHDQALRSKIDALSTRLNALTSRVNRWHK